MKIYIKNMVSIRCVMVVQAELKHLGIEFFSVELGSIHLMKPLIPEQFEQLKNTLLICGLELVEDKKSILIDKIKTIILDLVYNHEERLKLNFSTYLEEKLNYDYTYMSNLFSEVTAVSIVNYTIALKIERAKELLVHEDLTLTEISYKLDYSSVGHLSNQFKKYIGLTPSEFKNIQQLKKAYALKAEAE